MQIRKLNTIRALAASIVLITHFSDATNWLDGVLGGRAGQYGVMLFFLLSGFLMAYLYLNKSFNKANITAYVTARAARILPLYLFVIMASFIPALSGLQGLYDIGNPQALLAHLIFVYGDSVLWTIAPEMHFYAVFIALWGLFAWRPGYIILLTAGVLIALFLLNFPRPHGDIMGIPYDFHLFRSLPYFLVGMVLGLLYKTTSVPDYLRSHWFMLSLLLIPLLYPEFSPVRSDARMRMWLNYEVLVVMTAIFYSLVFLVPDTSKWLANRLGDALGKISFSLYLLHMPILSAVNALTISIELKLFLFLTLSILIAWLSYSLLEKPAARFIRAYAGNSTKRQKQTINTN